MKSKFFVIVAIIALVGFVVTLDYGEVWAQQQGPSEPFDSTKGCIPVEFSTDPDVDTSGNPDPQQVLYSRWGLVYNAFDFGDGDDVDALANGKDALFQDLIQNRAKLLVSFQNDPGWRNPPPDYIAIFMEFTWGYVVPLCAQRHIDINGVHLPNDGTRELDGLEAWGQPTDFDADHYSLIGDPGNPKVSVFYYDPITTISTPYVYHSVIVAAVVALGYEGPEELVDLDALMVWDEPPVSTWSAGDEIIFSIRAAGNWDGGEIVHMSYSKGAQFLNHGKHLWNTDFTVAYHFQLNPPTEEVDAIEAYPQRWRVPALTHWGLIILVALLIASTVFVMLKRRKAAVRA